MFIEKKANILFLTIVFLLFLQSTTNSKDLSFEKEFNIIKVDIAMDGNRNGVIEFDNIDDKKYLFWVNDDRDVRHLDNDIGMATTEIAEALKIKEWHEDDKQIEDQKIDCENDYIGNNDNAAENSTNPFNNSCKRDLEDFTQLNIKLEGIEDDVDISYYLQFENMTGSPSINIFEAVKPSFDYLTDSLVASTQLGKKRLITVSSEKTELNKKYIKTGEISPFLIEGKSEGKGKLFFIVEHNGNILCKNSLELELKSIKNFYQKFTVGITGNGDEVDIEDIANSQYEYLPKTNNYILFVHGWNLPEWLKERWAETMFKRLWWLGYDGHCGLFSWPTKSGFLEFAPRNWIDYLWHYNHSEMRAWNSAAVLQNRLQLLDSKYKGKIRVLAHSMGNVVASEALRRESLLGENSNLSLHTFISSQAAISGHSYDNTIHNYWNEFTTPNVYGFNYSGDSPDAPYFEQLTQWTEKPKMIRFHNKLDFALCTWDINNKMKPDYNYYYSTLPDDVDSSKGKQFWNKIANQPLIYRHLTFPDNRFEIFAFCAESRSYALGAVPTKVNGFDAEFDLSLLGYDYKHYSHSKQFRSNSIDEKTYWQKVIEVAELPIIK